ncbi:hypothetical protein HDV01_001205 [Terramyces sp. JEL0728]|nr:hypothetical protein HDV01_001205 [Terramyces sp. JEL0728]
MIQVPQEIQYLISEYLGNVVPLSLTCKYFYQFYTPIRNLVKEGFTWPIVYVDDKNYEKLSLHLSGFKFNKVILNFEGSKDKLNKLPPTRSVAIIFKPVHMRFKDATDDARFEWKHLLDCKLINQITVEAVIPRHGGDYYALALAKKKMVIPGIIENLHCWPNLRKLEIANRHVDFNLLAKYLSDSTVTVLNIQYGTNSQEIFHVLESANIKSLLLDNCNLLDDDIIQLANVLGSSKLQNLSLFNNKITDTGAIALAQSVPKSKLKLLDIRGQSNNITSNGAKAILDTIPISTLKGFNLPQNQTIDVDLDRLVVERLCFYSGETLHLSNYDASIHAALCENFNGSKVQEMEISISSDYWKDLGELLNVFSKSRVKKLFFPLKYPKFLSNVHSQELCELFYGYINALPIERFQVLGIHTASVLMGHITKESKLNLLEIYPVPTVNTDDLLMIAQQLEHTNIYEIKIEKGSAWTDENIQTLSLLFTLERLQQFSVCASGCTPESILKLAETVMAGIDAVPTPKIFWFRESYFSPDTLQLLQTNLKRILGENSKIHILV